jgi:hypothetical protein
MCWFKYNESKNIKPYNNPFIGSLIPNDLEYIKLINNLEYYINCEPKLSGPRNNSIFAIQNKFEYYKHPSIRTPHPIIYLDDIEIHYIHEYDNNICLDKFIRRMNRLKDILLNKNYKIIITLSFSELINDHSNINDVINCYFKPNLSKLNIEKYFLGPPKYNNNNINYINVLEWENISLCRNSSHVYNFNNQPFSQSLFINNIKFL